MSAGENHSRCVLAMNVTERMDFFERSLKKAKRIAD